MAIEYIWKDRKRYLGMPLSFTRYALSEDRLFLSVGFLNVKDEEVLLYRVRDISSSRSLGQRLLGVGTITVTSSDKSTPTLVLKNVRKPQEVKELLHSQVEKIKIQRRVRLNEISSDGHDHCDCDDNSEEEDDDLENDLLD